MKASRECRILIQHYEDCRLVSYPDPKTGAAPWTIGWGATGPGIGPGLIWSQQQADDRFSSDIAEREVVVDQSVHAPMSQGQFDAFLSILQNVGHGIPDRGATRGRDGIIVLRSGQPSSLLRLLNAGQYDRSHGEFAKWISPGSSVEYGLKRRRRAEQGLWDGLSARDAIAISEAEFPIDRRH